MMDLLKKKALCKESVNLLGLEAEGVPNYPLVAATNLQNEVSNTILEQSTEQYPQEVSTDILIQQLTETLASHIQQQKLQMQVEIWLDKLESVAEIHNFPHGVMLAAATSKLTKSARRWFDYSMGTINRSN